MPDAPNGHEFHCPTCGLQVDRRSKFDSQQNTELQPCGCVVGIDDLREAWTSDGGTDADTSDRRCPNCQTSIEQIRNDKTQMVEGEQHTVLEPCGCIVSLYDLPKAWINEAYSKTAYSKAVSESEQPTTQELIDSLGWVLDIRRDDIKDGLTDIMELSAGTAEAKGFWDGKDVNDRFPEAIALVHSELSEALEAHRNDRHVGDDSVLEELADVVIRVADLAAHYERSQRGLEVREELATQLTDKMAANLDREERHGKRY